MSEYVCDICHSPLTRREINAVSPSEIVGATSKGFVPSRLPKQIDTLASIMGVEVSDSEVWEFTVSRNAHADWGICKNCLAELKRW